MLIVNGKEVPETLAELVDPRSTALVVVDMQNDCCSPGGSLQRAGGETETYADIIPALARLIAAARREGVRIVYVQNTMLPDRLSDSPAQIRLTMRVNGMYTDGRVEPLEYTVEGTWGHAIVDELAPQAGDLIVKKFRSSAFVGTNLDLLLRSNGIRSVIITGCTTEGCVDSTVRDAGFYDYFAVVPRDCVGSDNRALHDAALFIMSAYRADVTTNEEIIRAWAGRKAEAAGS